MRIDVDRAVGKILQDYKRGPIQKGDEVATHLGSSAKPPVKPPAARGRPRCRRLLGAYFVEKPQANVYTVMLVVSLLR